MTDPTSRWQNTDAPRGADYDARWKQMEEDGKDPHGEVAFVQRYSPERVLDAGCGTGRVAIELANRGLDVTGFDLDAGMLDEARAKAPELTWIEGDAATIDLTDEGNFDLIVMAGNVMIFVEPGTEAAVVVNMARHIRPGGHFIAGFSLSPDRYDLASFDLHAKLAGLELEDRYATWDGGPFDDGDYAVSVFRFI